MAYDYRNSKETDPDKYFGYTAPNCYPPTIFYILKTDLEQLKEGKLPEKGDYSVGGSCYYKNTDGDYGGSACKELFFRAPEIQSYLANDTGFIKKAVDAGITWFLPSGIDVFVF